MDVAEIGRRQLVEVMITSSHVDLAHTMPAGFVACRVSIQQIQLQHDAPYTRLVS